MAEELDSVHINHLIDKFKASHGPEEPLPLNEAKTYVEYCISNVINKFDRQEKVNSVCVLANLVGRVPWTLHNLFDNQLFVELIKMGCQKPSGRLANEMFKIINGFLKRVYLVFPTNNESNFAIQTNNLHSVYYAIYTNLQIIDACIARLRDATDSIAVYLTVEFLAYLYYEFQNAQFECFANIFDYLRKSDVASACEKAFKVNISNPKLTKDFANFFKLFQQGLARISVVLKNTKIDTEIPSHRKIVDKVLKFTKRYALKAPNDKDTDLYEKAGITADPVRYIVENYTLSTLFNARVFFGSSDETFRKKYYQQLVLATPKTCFPLSKMCFLISQFLSNELFFVQFNNPEGFAATQRMYGNLSSQVMYFDRVYSAAIVKSLQYWEESKAENVDLREKDDNSSSSGEAIDDAEVILELIKATFRYANNEVGPKPNADAPLSKFFQIVDTVTYSQIREIQLKQIFDTREKYWGNEIVSFDSRLEIEVANFVKEERTLQLITGNWFYSEDPRTLESNSRANPTANGNGIRNRKTKRCYVSVSPNRRHLLFKDFKTGMPSTTQVLESSDAKSIQFAAVKEVKVTSLSANGASADNSSSNSSMIQSQNKFTNLFVTIKTKNVFHKIALLDQKGTELGVFYTDTTDLANLWSDGLKMLMNKPMDEISDFTRSQISKLFDVRRAVQFISIIDQEIIEVPEARKVKGDAVLEDESEGLYDYEELIRASEGFYYKD